MSVRTAILVAVYAALFGLSLLSAVFYYNPAVDLTGSWPVSELAEGAGPTHTASVAP